MARKPGPQPKALEAKRALGNPGHQKLPARRATAAVEPLKAAPPPSLSPEAARLWQLVVDTCPWVAVSDTAALLEACRLFEQRERLLAAIASDGDIVRNPSGRPVVHPAWAVVVQLWKLLGDYLAQFGLSPSERSRLGLGEIKAAQGMSRIEEMMQRQQRKHPSK